ncbi:ATP-binding protein [Nanoarchaeota archaeon]
MHRSLNKEGKIILLDARERITLKDYQEAINLLRKAVEKFDSAIKTAKLNSQTNFIINYENNMKIARELLNNTIRSQLNISTIDSNDKNEQQPQNKNPIPEKKTIEIPKEEEKIEPKEMEVKSGNNNDENEINKDDKKELMVEDKPQPVIQKEQITKIIDNEDQNIFQKINNNISIILGEDEKGGLVLWNPLSQANQHLVTVGMSGTGKTTALRTILYQLEKQSVPLIIFDLHDDFQAQKTINFSDITINPLELDGLTPKEKAIEFAYICKRIFGLGDQQENKLREAIIYCYQKKGIDLLDKNTYNIAPPTLKDINDHLEENRDGKTIDTLLGRVKFFHRIELFMKETRCPFNEMFKGSTVIKLIEFSDNPDLQTALCEIFLNKLLFTVKKSGQSSLRAYCVIDEAHILDDGKDSYRSPLVKIAREARKYGLGLILASQMPKDFSKSVLHNTATIMTLKFNAKEEAKAVSEQMYGLTETDILNLGEIGFGFVKLGNEVKRIKFFQQKDIL